MHRLLRLALLVTGFSALIFTLAFFFQVPALVNAWPWPAGKLSNIFIASILAAAACPVIWIGFSGETRALAGGGIDFGVTYAASGVFALQRYSETRLIGALVFGILALALAVLCFVIWFFTRRIAFKDTRPIPLPVRFSFGFFAVVLLFVGGSLALQRPNIFPWQLSPENSTIYGWIFLGAMCYFLYALVHPVWGNARGQLIGFLAYDLVLIVPFIAHFQTVKAELLVNLAVYTAVVIFSGLLAIYYLFLHKSTRFELGARTQNVLPAKA